MNEEELKKSVEKLKTLFPLKELYKNLIPLIELTESVLQVEGLPEKEDCEDCGCAACSEGLGGCMRKDT